MAVSNSSLTSKSKALTTNKLSTLIPTAWKCKKEFSTFDQLGTSRTTTRNRMKTSRQIIIQLIRQFQCEMKNKVKYSQWWTIEHKPAALWSQELFNWCNREDIIWMTTKGGWGKLLMRQMPMETAFMCRLSTIWKSLIKNTENPNKGWCKHLSIILCSIFTILTWSRIQRLMTARWSPIWMTLLVISSSLELKITSTWFYSQSTKM